MEQVEMLTASRCFSFFSILTPDLGFGFDQHEGFRPKLFDFNAQGFIFGFLARLNEISRGGHKM